MNVQSSQSRHSGMCSVPMQLNTELLSSADNGPLLEQACGLSQALLLSSGGVCPSVFLAVPFPCSLPGRGCRGPPCAGGGPTRPASSAGPVPCAVCPHGLGWACVAAQLLGLTQRVGPRTHGVPLPPEDAQDPRSRPALARPSHLLLSLTLPGDACFSLILQRGEGRARNTNRLLKPEPWVRALTGE
uniref:Uncharacterized protein n=1 Tax=Myotis myotis TaxID=51298 RepID=A0A7J7ZYK7_MYOMY|nr:hypothetical protein mMyoMyo1_010018 [Myotis myotis]